MLWSMQFISTSGQSSLDDLSACCASCKRKVGSLLEKTKHSVHGRFSVDEIQFRISTCCIHCGNNFLLFLLACGHGVG